MIGRRLLLAGLLGAALPVRAAARADELAALEMRSGGRLGVAILDTGSGRRAGHRENERFAMCSTFKLLAAALTLARVDRGVETLAARVAIPAGTVTLPHSPVAATRVGGSMTVAELCEAAMIVSDNSAANLLLERCGGPPGVTAFARCLGDRVTRLDRTEPTLNDVPPGDARDTTSPAAMVGLLQRLVLGDALTAGSRQRLTGWLAGNRTGDARLRAGLPAGWRAGDKTGTADGVANDIAVLWPPRRAPLVVTCYLSGSPLNSRGRDAIVAEVGRLVAAF